MGYTFLIYIFDKDHKLVSVKEHEHEFEYEQRFLDHKIESILVSEDEMKED